MAKVSGEFHWIKVGKNFDTDDYGNETHQVQLIPDEAGKKELEAIGMKDYEGMFRFKRAVEWPSGDKRDVPKVTDSDGTPLVPSTVGNGSKGVLQYKVVEGVWKKKPWKKYDLCAIRVDELIKYGGEDGDELIKSEVDEDPFN